MMEERGKRRMQQFVDIVPGLTTEVYLELSERRSEAERADARQPALVMLHGDLPGQVFRLRAGRQLIGRRVDCDIRLREQAISSHHAEIVMTDAGVSLSDLSSANGTVVNGRRIGTAVFLAQGNLLKLGNSVFKYVDSLMEVELTEQLHTRATIDPLTSIWNRAHFVARLAYMIDAVSTAGPVMLIAFEIDHFAGIIDNDGRARANSLLRDIAVILARIFGDEGSAHARVGDGSFAVAVGNRSLAAASMATNSLITALHALGVAVSVGVTSTEQASETAEMVLARAEALVSHARRQGGNRVSM